MNMKKHAHAARIAAFYSLGAVSCGGASAGDAKPVNVAGDGGAQTEVSDRCAAILDQSGQAYPARREQASSELDEFRRRADLFREHYGATGALYSATPKSATVSPDVALLRADSTVIGIQFGQGPLSLAEMAASTEEFVAQWSDFLNPYQVELVGQVVTQDRDLYVQRDFLQSFCGLDVRYGDQHEYNGRLHFTAYRGSATLFVAYSSLVPLVPLPPAKLVPEDVLPALTGRVLERACGASEPIASSACIRSEPRRVVFVAPDGNGIEYRLAYELELQTTACSEDEAIWTVFIDAVDGTPVYSVSSKGCPIE
jgi:hypothetical protein